MFFFTFWLVFVSHTYLYMYVDTRYLYLLINFNALSLSPSYQQVFQQLLFCRKRMQRYNHFSNYQNIFFIFSWFFMQLAKIQCFIFSIFFGWVRFHGCRTADLLSFFGIFDLSVFVYDCRNIQITVNQAHNITSFYTFNWLSIILRFMIFFLADLKIVCIFAVAIGGYFPCVFSHNLLETSMLVINHAEIFTCSISWLI